jgi:hypothetical protein
LAARNEAEGVFALASPEWIGPWRGLGPGALHRLVGLAVLGIAGALQLTTASAHSPLYRPLVADVALVLVSLRLVYDARSVRLALWQSGWIGLPGVALLLLWASRVDAFGLGIPLGIHARLLGGGLLCLTVLVVAQTSTILHWRIWSLDARKAAALYALGGGALLGMIQLAAVRGEAAGFLTVEGIRVPAVALLLGLLAPTTAGRLGAGGALAATCLAGAVAVTASFWSAASPVAVTVLAALLLRPLFERNALLAGAFVHVAWALAALASSLETFAWVLIPQFMLGGVAF